MDKELLKKFQHSWSRQKYWVMARSQQAYNEIRLLAKHNDWTEEKQARYEEILQELESVAPTTKTLTVTYQHIWGYFKRKATEAEKTTYKELLATVANQNQAMEAFLKELTITYQEPYLSQIRWISE